MFPRTFVIVLFLAAQTALLWWTAARDRTPDTRVAWTTIQVPVPALVATPPAPPAPPAVMPPVATPPLATPPPAIARPSCPPPRTDASSGKRELPHGVNQVTTSLTNAGWIAAWDEHAVFVSYDGGASFAQALDGPGQVGDVAFDCFGHLIVTRGNLLGVRDGTHEAWRAVPGIDVGEDEHSILIGGGPDVVLAGAGHDSDSHLLLAISGDLGATWWYRQPDVYWDASRGSGREDANGTVQLAITSADCMNDLSWWIIVRPDGTLASDALGDVGDIRLYGDVAIATRTDSSRIGWKRFGERAWRPVSGLPDVEPELVGGPLPRVVGGGHVYSVHDGRAKQLRAWSYSETNVDRAGRLWAIDETIDGEDAWLVGD